MKEKFLEFVKTYDQTNWKIKVKINHTLRVANLMKEFAKRIGLDEELAYTIGLLHDIGRFEQIKLQDNFDDLTGFDHAEYGADILFKDGLIKDFCSDSTLYPLIEFAIRNHNKKSLVEVEDKNYRDMAKLIRDVDKLDIINVYILGEGKLSIDESKVSEGIFEDIESHHQVDVKNVKTDVDHYAVFYGFAFDLNYSIILKPFRKNLESLSKQIKINEDLIKIHEIVDKYLEERIDEDLKDNKERE